jgi:hypothetical protein
MPRLALACSRLTVGCFVAAVLAVATARAGYLRNEPQTSTKPDVTVVEPSATADEDHGRPGAAGGFTVARGEGSGPLESVAQRDGRPVPTGVCVGCLDPADLGMEENLEPGRGEPLTCAGPSQPGPAAQLAAPDGSPQSVAGPRLVVLIRFAGEPEFAAVANGWVVSYQDRHQRGYFLPFNATTNPGGYDPSLPAERAFREHTLLSDAVSAIAAQVPASLDLDADGDGIVDGVSFIVSGRPESGGTGDLLWPHHGAMSAEAPVAVSINGRVVEEYDLRMADVTSGGSNTVIFSDNFEGSFPGQWHLMWSVTAGTDTSVSWGRCTNRAAGGSGSMWCAGGGSHAHTCGTSYAPNEGTWAVYGPFSLADATAATLDFDLWLLSQSGADYLYAMASTDGYYYYYGLTLAGTTGGWVHKTVNLSGFPQITPIGASQVWIAFVFVSNSSTQAEGAYVDNVVIQKTTAAPCTYGISPNLQSFQAAGGTGTFGVTASATSCGWTAASNASWVQVTSGASGTGNGSVGFSVASNSGAARSGTITAAGQTFTVNQDAPVPPTCTSFTIAPTLANAASTAGSQGVTLTGVPSGCTGGSWTASGNGTWITVSPGSGSGPGSTTVSWGANGSSSPRSGSATVAGQTFTVNQAGAGGGGYPYSYWLQVISHTSGAGGTQWRSDVGVFDRSATAANIEYMLYTGSSVLAGLRTVAGKAQLIDLDLASQLGFTTGSGALQVLSTQPLVVTSRTYNLATSGFTYGQGYDGVVSSDGLSAGESAYLTQLSQTGVAGQVGTTRTNIGVTNTGAATASVTVKIFTANGTQVWSDTRSYGPGQFYQYQEPYRLGAGLTNVTAGYAVVTVNSGSGVISSASSIDNGSGDPTTRLMTR